MNEPDLKDRVTAAIFIMAFGAEKSGVMTTHRLMWPYTDYEPDEVNRAATALMASVHTELLKALPQSQIEQISTRLSSYLSFVAGDGSLDEKILSQEDG